MHDSEALAQRKYQLRFDWGLEGAARIAGDADILVWVDALPSPGPETGPETGPDTGADGVATALAQLVTHDEREQLVLAATLRNRRAVARRILALQEERATRLSVAVIAAAESRPAVEDQLAAGAVIDALVSLGIDHTSPEAAFACAGFEGLRRAVVHLTSASSSGVELRELGRGEDVGAASQLDADELVPELRDGAFQA